MVRLFVIVFVVLVGVADRSVAWQEPTDFAGVPWGESESFVKLMNTMANRTLFRCEEADRGRFPRVACVGEFSWFNVPGKVALRFRPGVGFVAAEMRFWAARFSEMKQGLTDQYGPPTQEEQQPRRTPGGLPYVNEIVRWQGVKVQMNLQKYPVDFFSDAEFFIMLTEEMERQYR